MDCQIRKIPGVIVEAEYREIDSRKINRTQTVGNLAAKSLDVLADSLSSPTSAAIAGVAAMTILMLNPKNAYFKAQELTFKPTYGGKQRCFLQLMYKETGFIKPGTRGNLVEYGSSRDIRFMPKDRKGKHYNGDSDDAQSKQESARSRELEKRMEERERRIADREKRISEREKHVRGREQRVNERETRMSERDKRPKDKEVKPRPGRIIKADAEMRARADVSTKINLREAMRDEKKVQVKPRIKRDGLRKPDVHIISM